MLGSRSTTKRILHGKDGRALREVQDARGRSVRGEGPRPDLTSGRGFRLHRNIDPIAEVHGWNLRRLLQGGAIAIGPEIPARFSDFRRPSWDPKTSSRAEFRRVRYKAGFSRQAAPVVNIGDEGNRTRGSTVQVCSFARRARGRRWSGAIHEPIAGCRCTRWLLSSVNATFAAGRRKGMAWIRGAISSN